MERYFEQDEMIEERKYKFIKLRLIHQARIYWKDLERIARHRIEKLVTT